MSTSIILEGGVSLEGIGIVFDSTIFEAKQPRIKRSKDNPEEDSEVGTSLRPSDDRHLKNTKSKGNSFSR
jgi:hypothetical protein